LDRKNTVLELFRKPPHQKENTWATTRI
jgi:hypothetical protein